MAKDYPPKTYNEIKKLFVQDNHSPAEISKMYGRKPCKQTITLWASQKDKHNKNWHDYRLEFRDKQYINYSPQGLVNKILTRLEQILNEDWTDKTADQLVKLQVSMEKLTAPKYQVPVMFYMLEELLKYVRKHHHKFLKDNQNFLEIIRDFKNHLRAKLES